MKSNPQRDLIWQELHARPYVRFSAPAHALHFCFLTGEGAEEADRANLLQLKETLRLTATHETPRQGIYAAPIAGLGNLVLAWERHTEFVTYTFFLYELRFPFRPFSIELDELLPANWLESVGGLPLVATRFTAAPRDQMPDTLDSLMALFEGHTLNGSEVMAGRAEAWSCYRSHGDGLGRIALVVDGMSPQELGRTAQRLFAVEDFYHLTLLSLPLAREVKPDLASTERRMVAEMDKLRGADLLEQKRAVLDNLLGLAAEVEHLRARVSNRFGASSAYFALLENRFATLREAKIEHVLRLSRFVLMRLRPAAETYRGILERLADLSERIARAADLLRTSIELNLGEQNRRLLESSDRRARLQLRLQESVEGLSIVVITYYALGLIGYLLKGIGSLGLHVDGEAVVGLAVPVVLLTVWAVVHGIRKRFRDRS